jgi:uncharacterized membrane protein
MNTLLVRTLEFLNGFIAVLIVGACTMSGMGAAGGFGAVVGLLGGIVIAAVVCGLIAYLSLIERHLSTIATSSKDGASNLRFLAKSATLQNAIAEMQIAAQEEAIAGSATARRIA